MQIRFILIDKLVHITMPTVNEKCFSYLNDYVIVCGFIMSSILK